MQYRLYLNLTLSQLSSSLFVGLYLICCLESYQSIVNHGFMGKDKYNICEYPLKIFVV
jgi:hypothetical protein